MVQAGKLEMREIAEEYKDRALEHAFDKTTKALEKRREKINDRIENGEPLAVRISSAIDDDFCCLTCCSFLF